MKAFGFELRRAPASAQARPVSVGDFVLYYDCRGCMSDDHRLIYAGQVARIVPGQVERAVVRVIKRGAVDVRDGVVDEATIVVWDGALQRLVPGLWAYYG